MFQESSETPSDDLVNQYGDLPAALDTNSLFLDFKEDNDNDDEEIVANMLAIRRREKTNFAIFGIIRPGYYSEKNEISTF